MPRLHIIIGDANTRKSSLLRSLTGVVGGRTANQHMDILLTNGSIINVYCTTSALQENLNPKTPEQFIEEINSLCPMPTDIAITLRAKKRAGYPSAADYILAFRQAEWHISSAALLGHSAAALNLLLQNVAVATKVDSPIRPTNETASLVRKIWGWQ